jgi:hypothetical protein
MLQWLLLMLDSLDEVDQLAVRGIFKTLTRSPLSMIFSGKASMGYPEAL